MKIILLHGEIFTFPKSLFFCLKIVLNVNGKATVCDTPLVVVNVNVVFMKFICPSNHGHFNTCPSNN